MSNYFYANLTDSPFRVRSTLQFRVLFLPPRFRNGMSSRPHNLDAVSARLRVSLMCEAWRMITDRVFVLHEHVMIDSTQASGGDRLGEDKDMTLARD